MSELIVICFACFMHLVLPFNLETRIPVIKKGNNGSYFGFSVAEHQTIVEDEPSISWMLVGAPLDQNSQPGTNRSGALWKCPMTTWLDDCEQVVTDGKRSLDSNDLRPPHSDEIKNGQWLGVTVRSQGPGGKVVVCAHRYIRKSGESQFGQGLCYTLDTELNYDNNWDPCKGRDTDREHEEFGYCQAGTSSSFLSDGTMVLGSPGSYTWQGTVFIMSTSGDFLSRDKRIFHGPLSKETTPVDKYSYLGMSVTGGRFFGSYMSYVAGAPRSEGTGQVVIFSKNTHAPWNPINVSMIISGEQFASNFGYEIATADFNGDGKDDLAISAPFYFTRDFGGAVYIYINKDFNFSPQFSKKLTGKLESRFGFALANAGDLNKDGCDDLALGSPYDGSGVVYIYLGNRESGLDELPKQTITAEMLPMTLKTFGYSLSGGLDLDGNGYPDLLVGAYEEDSIALLLGRPIIDIKTFIKPDDIIRNVDPSKHGCDADPSSNNTCFSFETCCRIEALVKSRSSETLTLNYVIEAETFSGVKRFSRVYFNNSEGSQKSHITRNTITLTRNARGHCQQHIVYIKENPRDFQTPIKFHVNYTLDLVEPHWSVGSRQLYSVEGLPILNATQATREFEARLLRDCGEDDICHSNIEISATLALPRDDKRDQYVLTLGEQKEVHLIIKADNLREPAYDAQLFVSHHPKLSYVATNVTDKHITCSVSNETFLICTLGNPFKRQVPEPHPITIRFNPKHIEDHELAIKFSIWTNSSSNDTRPTKTPIYIEAIIVKNAEVSIRGSARPEQVLYGGVVKGESATEYLDDIGSRVIHTYQIFNSGPSRVNSVEVVLDWPHQVANNKPQGKWLLYLEAMPTVEAQGGGLCKSDPNAINPLKLVMRPGVDETPLENLYKFDSQLNTANILWPMRSSTNNQSELNSMTRRGKRDSEMIVKSEAYTDKDGKGHHFVNMSCSLDGMVKCIKIYCSIFRLERNQAATISIRARLWNSSLVEDYPRVEKVLISSRATLKLPSNHNIKQQNLDDDTAVVETKALPDLVSVEIGGIPIWVYIISVIAGILVLICFILVLWKLGFFKRRRLDLTLSGNLGKNHEGSPFLG